MGRQANAKGKRNRGAGAPELVAAVAQASLEELKTRYPAEWERTGRALVAALESGHAAGAARWLAHVRAEAAPWRTRLAKSGGNAKVADAALPLLVRARMAELALKEVVDGVAAARATGKGPTAGVVRFSRWSGTLINALFFRGGLERKPVSPFWFRVLWPLVTEKELLMPLVEPRGIYCFYARPLVTGLARLIDEVGGPAIEIAAGDGTLTRFLEAAGVTITASDDQTWSATSGTSAVSGTGASSDVERLDAESALRRDQPRVVVCSWPPPGNRFEAHVFRTASVARYIVLTTRHRFAAGAWPAYDEAAASFDRRVDEALSPLILPPTIDPVVLIFDRR